MTKLQQITALINWAEVAQIVGQGLITVAVLTYLAGWHLGRWLHRANDQLASIWVRLWVRTKPAVNAPDQLQCNGSEAWTEIPASPLQHPLQAVATELQQLTVKELQLLCGTRRRLAKRELVAMALAC